MEWSAVSTDVSPPAGPPKVGVLVAVALLWAVVGGPMVAFVARGSSGTPASRNGQPAACAAVDVAHDILPSVVTVLTRGTGGSGNGTGEIVRTGGYILTNDHVIAAAADAGEVAVRYDEGTTSPAKIVGRDPLTDLAVLHAGDQAEGRPRAGRRSRHPGRRRDHGGGRSAGHERRAPREGDDHAFGRRHGSRSRSCAAVARAPPGWRWTGAS